MVSRVVALVTSLALMFGYLTLETGLSGDKIFAAETGQVADGSQSTDLSISQFGYTYPFYGGYGYPFYGGYGYGYPSYGGYGGYGYPFYGMYGGYRYPLYGMYSGYRYPSYGGYGYPPSMYGGYGYPMYGSFGGYGSYGMTGPSTGYGSYGGTGAYGSYGGAGTTAGYGTSPSAPAGGTAAVASTLSLSGSSGSGGSVNLSWSGAAVLPVQSFVILASSGGNYQVCNTINDPLVTSATCTGLTSGAQYNFLVLAVGAGGMPLAFSNTVSITPP